ncbi:tetratricopeptide repeat protein [Candidatus Fermentibacteria bacterium]|nr:tetratricopeptide repeat protein [Candidatus Fermentibacteria bacterium]
MRPHSSPVTRRGRLWWIVGAALVALNVVAFLPGLGGDFVWDDDLLLLDHPNYRRPELILSSLRSLFIISPSYFRPLGYFSFFLDYAVFGPRPLWYHLENLVLHCAATLLVLRFLALLKCSPLVAFAAAAVFAVHPSRVEGVVFISSRFDLLAMTCMLCALLLHRRALVGASWRLRWAAAVVYGLALASKEMAVTMPALAWYADRYLWPDVAGGSAATTRRLRSIRGYAPYAVALFAYLALRASVLGSLVVSRDLAIPLSSSLDHVILVGKTIFGYLRFTVLPFFPNPVHYTDALSPADVEAWLGFAAVLLAVWAWLTGYLRGGFRDGVVLFLLLLIPVANIVPIRLAGPSYMAERFLYAPLLGVVLGLRNLPWHRRGLRGAFLVVLMLWGAITHHASANWVDDRALFTWVARRAPQSALGFTNLALEETRGGFPGHAVALSESALVRDRANPDAWDNLGVAYYQLGRLAEAESCFVQALRLAPGHPLFSANLAGTWRTMDRCPEALNLLGEVIARDGTAASAHLNIGLCYLRMGQPDDAVPALQRAATLTEIDTTTWMTLAQALTLAGREDEALEAVRTALGQGLAKPRAGDHMAAWGREALHQRRIGDAVKLLRVAGVMLPEDATIANDLGVSLRSAGLLAAAESSFSKAVALAPDLALAWANLGEVYGLDGKEDAADSVLLQTLVRWPDLADAYRHLGRLRLSQGRHDSARTLFAEYLRRAPGGVFAAEAQAILRE